MLKKLGAVVTLLLLVTGCAALAAATFPPSSLPVYDGIDVSDYQGVIDWARVKAAGIEFAYIRASSGAEFRDTQFVRNDNGAKANGILVGYYHFLNAVTVAEANAEANFFASVIAGRVPDGIVMVDYGAPSDLTNRQVSEIVAAFLTRVKQLTGYDGGIYTDASGARDRYTSQMRIYPLWVADWGVEMPEANGIWDSWVGFQYTARGRVDGINGDVDKDHFTKEVLLSSAEPTPTPQPTCVPTSPCPCPCTPTPECVG